MFKYSSTIICIIFVRINCLAAFIVWSWRIFSNEKLQIMVLFSVYTYIGEEKSTSRMVDPHPTYAHTCTHLSLSLSLSGLHSCSNG